MRLPITPATTLWRALRDDVRAHHRGGRVLLAVDGGGTTAAFADGLAEVFAETGASVFRASIDDFRRPREERDELGRDSPEGVYRDAFDYATFRRVLVDPFREGGQTAATTGFQLAAFDAVRDAPVESAWVTAPRDAVLIVDGVFLLRPQLRGIWHWSVWLEAPHAGPGGSPAGFEPYLRDARPSAAASAIVDDTDPAHPQRVFRDHC